VHWRRTSWKYSTGEFGNSMEPHCSTVKRLLMALFASAVCVLPLCAQSTGTIAKPLQVLRYRDSVIGLHAFTTDREAQRRLPQFFATESVPEGLASSPLFYLSTEPYGGTVPIYRFRAGDGSMRFAANGAERTAFRARGLEEVDQPVYVYSRKVEGASEIYRLSNPKNGDLIYSTSPDERDYYLNQGWTQQPSLGFTQATSSSGTGILRSTTVKLEEADLSLLSKPLEKDGRLVFSGTNAKLAAVTPGTVLYSEKNAMTPNGLVAKVSSISVAPSGTMEIETAQATFAEAFWEYHIFIDNRPLYFPPSHSGAAQAAGADTQARMFGTETVGSMTAVLRPDYLSRVVRPESAVQGTWTTNLDFDKKLLDEDCCTVELNADLTLSVTGEVFENYSFPFTDFSGEVLFTPVISGSTTLTGTLTLGVTADNIYVASESATFPVAGIPVTASANVIGGYGISGSVSETLNAQATVRATGGFSWNLNLVGGNSASVVACPNPCPSGFSCGTGYAGGPTCSLTARGSATFGTDNGVYAYLEPQLALGPGLSVAGFSVDTQATVGVKLQLEAKIEPPNINAYFELIPDVGADMTLGPWTWTPIEVDLSESSTKIWSYALANTPTITSIAPNPLTTSQPTWITVNGTGFQSGLTVTVAGYSIAAAGLQFVSSTQVNIKVTMGAGNYTANVVITSPSGTATGSFQVNTTPSPSITGLSPTSYSDSNSLQTMLINGANFQSQATLTFHDPQGNPYAGRATTFISGGELSHSFNDQNDPGTWTVFVTNPNGQTSNTFKFIVTAAPAPSISELSPSLYSASSSSQTMVINGANFQNNATLTFHDPQGQAFPGRAATFISSSQLSCTFNDQNDAGTWTVFVVNADGSPSNTWSFTVAPPSVTLALLVNPSNGGTVNGGGTYTVGSQPEISASANTGWTFTGWSDGNTQNPRTVTIPSGGASYTADFQQSTATVTVLVNPSNSGTVNGGGTYASGSQPEISASANTGWTFTGWSDGNTQNPRMITVPSGGASYTANFSAAGQNDFSIRLNPATMTVAQGGTGTYAINTQITAGNSQNVTLNVSSLPSGISFTLSQTSVQSGNSATVTLNVGTSVPVGTYTFVVSGTGNQASHSAQGTITVAPPSSGPALTLTPPSLTFSDDTVGVPSQSQLVTMRNAGGSTLTVTSLAIAAGSDYVVTGGPSFPLSLPPNTQTTFQVYFLPSTTGSRPGTIYLWSNAPGSPQALPLSGNGLAAAPTTGTIQVNMTLNGAAFPQGNFANYTLSGPSPENDAFPESFTVAPGNYTLQMNGPSSNLTLSSITPSAAQTVAAGSVVTFTMNFTAANDFTAPYIGNPQGMASPQIILAGNPASYYVFYSYPSGSAVTDITMQATGFPAGVTASFNPNPANGYSNLSVSTTTATAPGAYGLSVSGTNSSGLTRQGSSSTLVVTRAPASPAQMVSVTNSGVEGNAGTTVSTPNTVSADGRYVLLTSNASNLTGGANSALILHDTQSSTNTVTNIDPNNNPVQSVYQPSISSDGRFVLFSGSSSIQNYIFIRDWQAGTTERVDVASDGTPANNSSIEPSVSSDGRFVAFISPATNLVPNGPAMYEVYVRDRKLGLTFLASAAADGTPANAACDTTAISADGRFVAFLSRATNLTSLNTNGIQQAFLRDMQTGQTFLLSIGVDGNPANQDVLGEIGQYGPPVLSADGRFAVFGTTATNLVAQAADERGHVFLRDSQAQTTRLVDTDPSGNPLGFNFSIGYQSVSADGRFVVYQDFDHILVRDMLTGQTQAISVAPDGTPGNGTSAYPSLSSGGGLVAFQSAATNLTINDTNSATDVFRIANPFIGTPLVSSLVLTASPGAGRWSVSGTVTLSSPAPSGGVSVALSTNGPGVQVPAFVPIAAGSSGAAVQFNAPAVSAETVFTVIATLNGSSTVAIVTLEPMYSVAGQVTLAGVALSGISVAVSGSQTATTSTDVNGNYSFPGLAAGGSFTVTPSSRLYSFNSSSASFSNLAANQTASFQASVITYAISGQVTLSGAALGGVSVTLAGSQSGSTTTDSAGNYRFNGLPAGGSFTVTPSLSGFTFSPQPTTVSNLVANQTVNFSSAQPNLLLSATSTTGIAGQNVDVPIQLGILGTTAPATTQTDLDFDQSKLTFISARAGLELASAGKSLTATALSNGDIRLSSAGANTATIATGTVAYATFALNSQFASSSTPITLKNCTSTDVNGNNLTTSCSAGAVSGTQASQSISFGALSNVPFGSSTFGVSATATSGLTVSFASTTPLVCTMSGSTVILVSYGTCTVEATQSGSPTYMAASPVDESFQVIDACDVNQYGSTTIADIQSLVYQALGLSPIANDINGDGVVNVADVQTVMNDALGLGCEFKSATMSLSKSGRSNR